jgi:hypothetical protein
MEMMTPEQQVEKALLVRSLKTRRIVMEMYVV